MTILNFCYSLLDRSEPNQDIENGGAFRNGERGTQKS